MTKVLSSAATTSGRVSWNKGKIVGAKPPLPPSTSALAFGSGREARDR